MLEKIKVSAISYLNTIPFIYGIQNSPIASRVDLSLDVPSTCAKRLMAKTADLGIVPVAIIPSLPEYYIVSDYCIGTIGNVRSVALISNYSLGKIETLYIDKDSRTSALLVQLLAKKFWKIRPVFKPLNAINPNETNSAYMIIGDKVFEEEHRFKNFWDLSYEWQKFKKLPFVFATWTAIRKLDADFVAGFNKALEFGLNHIDDAVNNFKTCIDKRKAIHYLKNNISYNLDALKRKSLEEFWSCSIGEIKRDRVRC